MRESEILVSSGSDELMQHGVSIGYSSATAPWRDSVRIEQQSVPAFEIEEIPTWHTIAICRRGRSTKQVRVGGGPLQKFNTAPGQVLIYPAGQRVYCKTAQEMETLVMQLAPSILSAAAGEMGGPKELASFRVCRDKRIEQIAVLLEEELISGCSSGRLYGESLGLALAAHLMHSYGDGQPLKHPASKAGLPAKTVRTAIEYIQAHATGDLSLQALADLVQVSPFHFCRLFKQSTGFSPHQYVLHVRMETAKQLLRSSQVNIAQIAEQVGFQDQSQFSAAFRKITGITPSHWRRAS